MAGYVLVGEFFVFAPIDSVGGPLLGGLVFVLGVARRDFLVTKYRAMYLRGKLAILGFGRFMMLGGSSFPMCGYG